MSFIGEISSLSQTASNKMKGTAEYVRISGKITDLEKSLNQCYLQVGKAVCTTETTGRTPATEEIIKNAKQMQLALQELQGQLLLLKGNVVCPVCKNTVRSDSAFCNACGAVLRSPATGKVCKYCGAALEDDQEFCVACGKKVEASGSAPRDSVRICKNCGKPIDAGHSFCKYCGTRADI
ncbi:MAG: zinc ribbon domain-containing protein [Ruminococcus sp.]|nr:zinc ribbon domain-containing protein [Ruminococcus sp.]